MHSIQNIIQLLKTLRKHGYTLGLCIVDDNGKGEIAFTFRVKQSYVARVDFHDTL